MAGEQAGRQEPDPGMELRYELLANLMGTVGVVFFSLEALICLLDRSFFSEFRLVFPGLVCVFCGFLDSTSGDYFYGCQFCLGRRAGFHFRSVQLQLSFKKQKYSLSRSHGEAYVFNKNGLIVCAIINRIFMICFGEMK